MPGDEMLSVREVLDAGLAALAEHEALAGAIARTRAGRPEVAAVEAAVIARRVDVALGGDAGDLAELAADATRARTESAVTQGMLQTLERRRASGLGALRFAHGAVRGEWNRVYAAEGAALYAAGSRALRGTRARLAAIEAVAPPGGDAPGVFAFRRALDAIDLFPKAGDRADREAWRIAAMGQLQDVARRLDIAIHQLAAEVRAAREEAAV